MTTHNTTSPNATIVYVVDDDASVRAALEDLLQSVGQDVLVFESTQAFIDHGVKDIPGCLVLDVRMPGQSGMAFHAQMQSLGIDLPVIFITGHGDLAMGVKAMKQGAIEFLAKPFNEQDLLDAIHAGLDKDKTRREALLTHQALQTRWERLTPGEQQVMRLVVQGQLNKQIADTLSLSEITVKVRRASVMRKMQAKTLADLVRLADQVYAFQQQTDIQK
jgi:FixJ family two-component response regulator